jgi:hypothetical protein
VLGKQVTPWPLQGRRPPSKVPSARNETTMLRDDHVAGVPCWVDLAQPPRPWWPAADGSSRPLPRFRGRAGRRCAPTPSGLSSACGSQRRTRRPVGQRARRRRRRRRGDRGCAGRSVARHGVHPRRHGPGSAGSDAGPQRVPPTGPGLTSEGFIGGRRADQRPWRCRPLEADHRQEHRTGSRVWGASSPVDAARRRRGGEVVPADEGGRP